MHQRVSGWSLVSVSDNSRVGWIPDSVCRKRTPSDDNTDTLVLPASLRTFPVRQNWKATNVPGTLSLYRGEMVTVESVSASGWTLGIVTHDGQKSKGWLPDWLLDREAGDSYDYSGVREALQGARAELALGTK